MPDSDPGFPPLVLTFAASDPSGGAGIQADLLTLASMGCHPLSVITAITVQDSAGVEGMLANGWEWTSSLFEPFSGFEPFPFYKGYSADFFDGKHYVMKGGSTRTAESMLRLSFRNWFQPHYQYAYAGFRCAL